ncbi:MAG: M28 family peptidase, partial [Paludibacteraceae bacterium]|nr:M28 family peptidase [Paludibacteraceae bacterium]
TIDIIHYSESGFGHFWHTAEDNMSNVSAQTLQSVGEVVLSVVYDEK